MGIIIYIEYKENYIQTRYIEQVRNICISYKKPRFEYW